MALALAAQVLAGEDVPLIQDAYVWQRSWTEAVRNAVSRLASHFDELIPLRAEVTWNHRVPRLRKVAVNYPALRQTGRPIGIALRIGTFSGPFKLQDQRTRWLCGLARTMVAEARTNEVKLAELQLDFDCAESKLDGYRVWVEAINQAVAPVPVTITALPSWLKQPACARLVSAADGFVLQVHSFERPQTPDDPFQLCDPIAARRAVEKAGSLGRPFRVALPTYGYVIAFDPSGKFLGLSAEGPSRTWPVNATVRQVWADAVAMASLVRTWSTNRPAMLRGILWYRLPVNGDAMNWRWPTLATVMAGEMPQPDLRVRAQERESGLVDVVLENQGTADANTPFIVNVKWVQNRLTAADGMHGFAALKAGPHNLSFHYAGTSHRLAAGESRLIGWMRFSTSTDVSASLEDNSQ